MHRAPAVSFKVARSWWHVRLLAVLWLIGGFAITFLVLTQRLPILLTGSMALGVLLVGVVALRGWFMSPTGLLRWDGQHWYWEGFAEDAACQLALHLEFQPLLLVTVRNEVGNGAWLWLEKTSTSPQWSALRRAVVATYRTQTHAPDAEYGTVDA